MTKVFYMGAFIWGLMTSVGTGVLAQTDFSAPGSMEDIAKAPLINQESPGTPARAVGEEEGRSDQPTSEQMEAADESPAMRTAGTVSGEEKTPRRLKHSRFIENEMKRLCDRRQSEGTTEATDKACEAMGCDPYNPCGVE